jgi:hypothetical protein
MEIDLTGFEFWGYGKRLMPGTVYLTVSRKNVALKYLVEGIVLTIELLL